MSRRSLISLRPPACRAAQRLTSVPEQRGDLARNPDSRRYRIGVRLFELGSRFHNQLDIRRAPQWRDCRSPTCNVNKRTR